MLLPPALNCPFLFWLLHFNPCCADSFVFTYLSSVSCSVCLSLFAFLLGRGWKPSPFYFFLQRLLNISVLHFLSLFYAPSLFFPLPPRPLWCVCGFVIIPFGWAHRLRCTSTRTVTLFILETKGTHIRACILVYLSVFSTLSSTHITAPTALKYSAYLKGIFTKAIRVPSVVC